MEVYKNLNNDPKGDWRPIPMTAQAGHATKDQFYEIVSPSGKKFRPSDGRCWSLSQATFEKLRAVGRIYFGKNGDSQPNVIRYASEIEGFVPWTWWPSAEVGHTDEAKKELMQIIPNSEFEFDTIKPVRLLNRILKIATNKNSIVLDSFAGSGTTAHAVIALNKKDAGSRKFILVETEDYADKLTAERVRRVIKGYPFEGTMREELMREPLTWSKLHKASALIEKAESIEQLEGSRFDKVTKTVEDGALVITGEKRCKDKADGLGGSFTYCTLGPEMSIDKLLTDGLPSFEALAKYVFYTATGGTLTDLPKGKAAANGFIGETELYRVHLHYKQDKVWLQSNDAALTETLLDAMLAANTAKKKLLVFAAAKFMSQRELTKLGVDFCQLPYAIHRILGD